MTTTVFNFADFQFLSHHFRGKIHYTDVFNMLRQIDPPLGFGKKCPERMAYKKLIRMNMPMDKEGKVSFPKVYTHNSGERNLFCNS